MHHLCLWKRQMIRADSCGQLRDRHKKLITHIVLKYSMDPKTHMITRAPTWSRTSDPLAERWRESIHWWISCARPGQHMRTARLALAPGVRDQMFLIVAKGAWHSDGSGM